MNVTLLREFTQAARLTIAALLTCFSPSFSQPVASEIRIGEPYRIYPSTTNQIEPFITRHPTNPNILFASAMTYNPANAFLSEGIYVTTNGGASWRGNDTCTGAPITFHQGDPAVAIDKDGRFLLTRLGFPAGPGVYSHVSNNNGATWAPQRAIIADASDRAALISDVIPTSAFYGRSYSAWVRFAPPYPVYFAQTTDGGTSWSTPGAINAPTQRNQGAEISLGPNGRLNLCWARVINNSPYTEDFVGFATSTTGGATWTLTEGAFDVNGIQGLYPTKNNILVNGLPKIETDKTGGTFNGRIFIITTQRNLAPAGSDPDLVLYRSTNNGQSWLPGIRVNQDALNNGKTQLFPAIHVDDNGGVNILYYDDRQTSLDSLGVYLSRSTDGGTTWNDYRVSSKNFTPRAISGLTQGRMGDNLALTSLGNTLFPVWMDNSFGVYQVLTSPIDLATLEVSSDTNPIERNLRLEQNFPNPFNPTTTIRFKVPGSSMSRQGSSLTTLKVLDVLGREIATLINGELESGEHEAVFDASSLSSGVFFYKLQSGSFSATKKMILMK